MYPRKIVHIKDAQHFDLKVQVLDNWSSLLLAIYIVNITVVGLSLVLFQGVIKVHYYTANSDHTTTVIPNLTIVVILYDLHTLEFAVYSLSLKFVF